MGTPAVARKMDNFRPTSGFPHASSSLIIGQKSSKNAKRIKPEASKATSMNRWKGVHELEASSPISQRGVDGEGDDESPWSSLATFSEAFGKGDSELLPSLNLYSTKCRTQGFYVVRIRCKSYVHGLQLEFLINSQRLQVVFLRHPTFSCSSDLKTTKSSKLPVPKNKLKLSLISLVAADLHRQLLEGPVEAPTSSNSVVANPATDSSSVSTGLDTPPDPEIHRGPLTLSQLCKHSTGENFSVLVFKTQRLFVTIPGTHLVLPLSQNLLNGLDFLTRSTNIPLAPEFMFAK
ncbi:hypothetical protein LXL04_021918 [Taraxacum kok-saghyz]